MTFPGDPKKVLSGRQSEARYPADRPCRYRAGNDYAIKGGRVRLLQVAQQRLGDIQQDSIRREGHKTHEEFVEAWTQQHGSFDPEMEVWVLVFERAEERPLFVRRVPPAHVDRTDATGEVLPPTAEEIARAALDSAYTTDPSAAVGGAGDVLDPETQDRFTEEAGARFKVVHAEELSRASMRSYLNRLRQLGIAHVKAGRDPAPIFEQALAQLGEQEEAA